METKQKLLFEFPKLRTRNGRFCTKEQFRTERVDSDNTRLRYERDKYYRAWIAVSKKAAYLERELKRRGWTGTIADSSDVSVVG